MNTKRLLELAGVTRPLTEDVESILQNNIDEVIEALAIQVIEQNVDIADVCANLEEAYYRSKSGRDENQGHEVGGDTASAYGADLSGQGDYRG